MKPGPSVMLRPQRTSFTPVMIRPGTGSGTCETRFVQQRFGRRPDHRQGRVHRDLDAARARLWAWDDQVARLERERAVVVVAPGRVGRTDEAVAGRAGAGSSCRPSGRRVVGRLRKRKRPAGFELRDSTLSIISAGIDHAQIFAARAGAGRRTRRQPCSREREAVERAHGNVLPGARPDVGRRSADRTFHLRA